MTRIARSTGFALGGLAAIAAAVTTGLSALNGDVKYVLGGIETAGKGGVNVWDVFVARPISYRLLLDGLDTLQGRLAPGASLHDEHLIIRAETAVLIIATAVVLFFGIRRFLGTRAGATVAGATGLALIVSPPWHFLEPDWVAALAAVLAVGAALAPRWVWAGGVLGGLAAVTAVTVKLATAPIAMLALLLVATLDRRRAAWAAVATVVFGGIWYWVTKQLLPWEWIWLKDQANLVTDSPIHHGIRWADIRELLLGTGDVAIVGPIVTAAPAAAAALIRRRPPGRSRWIATGVAVLAAGLSVASAYGQAEFFSYHFAVVPILAAGVWGAAFALCAPARAALLSVSVLLAAACVVLGRQSTSWRVGNIAEVTGSVAAAAAVAAIIVAIAAGGKRAATRGHAPAWWAVGAVVLPAVLVQAVVPGAPYSFGTYNNQLQAGRSDNDKDRGLTALRERIGPDTPVLYLTFGTYNHYLGNPTTCRYPSPQWLQRAGAFPQVLGYPSFADNLACLTNDHQARFMIRQTLWFQWRNGYPTVVWDLLDKQFDCSPAARVPSPPELTVCPARKVPRK